jgi:uncharacterized protein YprB with RNaseH-like and TPR domain
MKIDAQRFLEMAEECNSIVFFDIECTGLRGDYGTMLCASFLPFQDEKATTFRVKRVGNDKKILKQTREMLEAHDVWVTYYGKGFDIPFVNTRLFRHSQPLVDKRLHLDLYYTGRHSLLTARRSQGHMLNWLEASKDKMSVSASMWAEVNVRPDALDVMQERCESDVQGLREFYKQAKVLVKDLKR